MSASPDGEHPPAATEASDGARSSAPSSPAPIVRRYVMVHMVRAPGAVSEAERAQAKATLEREFGDYERFRKSLPKDPPPTRPSSLSD